MQAREGEEILVSICSGINACSFARKLPQLENKPNNYCRERQTLLTKRIMLIPHSPPTANITQAHVHIRVGANRPP